MVQRQPTGLKRGLPNSVDIEVSEMGKKQRREDSDKDTVGLHTPLKRNTQIPSPLTNGENYTFSPPPSIIDTPAHERFVSPSDASSPSQAVSGSQTQPFSQVIYPPHSLAYEVEDEEVEGVWGYFIPMDGKSDKFGTLILKDRVVCAPSTESTSPSSNSKSKHIDQEKKYEDKRANNHPNQSESKPPSQGYLIGRHPECDLRIDVCTVSNRHCVVFSENRDGHTIAILDDTSGNGTFVNDALVGRNNRRELLDGDEVSILDEARFCFRYPRHRQSSAFKQQYVIHEKLGKGHFASVYLCVDRATGSRWAVKKIDRPSDKSRQAGLHGEIAVLMSINHPGLLCLKGAFDEEDGIYLILELAASGELFNHIVQKSKLSESETRKVFIQLFQAIKYLHDRNIVHRDIKPENILLIDDDLHVKLADFGLAKIIGESSFTTTLCGTPSYVAPEILQPVTHRKYTKAVDVWSLGVVLYICLCGFPPFSDELYSAENPYTLAQQILDGRYDYPSPYWDTVGDPALDLIDRMLTVDPDERISIDDCLEHPWITEQDISTVTESMQSLDGLLAGRMMNLDFSKRKPKRERTLLSQLNKIVKKKIVHPKEDDHPPVKIYEKNKNAPASSKINGKSGEVVSSKPVKEFPADVDPNEKRFLATGDAGDPPLFAEDESSRYPTNVKQNLLD